MKIRAGAAIKSMPGQNEVLDTSTQPAVARWDRLLTLQTELFFPSELAAFLDNDGWLRAATILDVGCGNGHYLSRLRSFFPGKSFTGIDTSPPLIAKARAQPEAGEIAFRTADYFSYAPNRRYDAILMRFVVQHMANMAAILAKADLLLTAGGSLFLVEPDLSRSSNLPPTPLFMHMLAAYEDHAASEGRIRAHLARLSLLVENVHGWMVASDTQLSVVNVGPFVGRPLLALFSYWIDLCQHAAGFPFPYDAVRRELEGWSRSDCFSRICLRLIQIRRRPAAPGIKSDRSPLGDGLKPGV